ncbi:hypothetical protein PGQ11_012633 [Apiospora arundinis]|uniref:Uncharacterized protein n=1 Tax=Apiospora arundinis TaxID=335852 RepID=A0ABR2I300_9PEZI
MSDISGLETQISSLSLHNGSPTSPDTPPLRRIPRHLRDLIYRHLLTLNQYFHYDPNESYFDTAILGVNHRIQDEALDCLTKTNFWIGFTTDCHLHNWTPQPCWSHCAIPEKCKERIAEEVAIRFIVERNPNTSRKSFIFPYHPSMYMRFIQDISKRAESIWKLDVLASPLKLRYPSAFTKLIEPLYTLRNLRWVWLEGLEGYPTNQRRLMSHMTRTSGTIESAAAIIEWHLKKARQAESGGRYSDALVYYDLGHWLRYGTRSRFARGTPEDNSLRHLKVDLDIVHTRNCHKHIVQLKKTATQRVVARHITRDFLLKHIQSGYSALAFPGLTDDQLCRAHLYNAFALFHYAECLSPYLDQVAFAWFKKYIPGHTPRFGDLYLHAIRSLFFARQADCWEVILAELSRDDLAVCKAIQERHGPQGWRVTECKVPLLDNWRGDPYVWRSWGKDAQLLLKQYRQRHNQNPRDLSGVYADIGIGLYSTQSGQLNVAAIDGDQESLFRRYGVVSNT